MQPGISGAQQAAAHGGAVPLAWQLHLAAGAAAAARPPILPWQRYNRLPYPTSSPGRVPHLIQHHYPLAVPAARQRLG